MLWWRYSSQNKSFNPSSPKKVETHRIVAVKAETPTPCYLVCPRFLTELPYAALSAEAKLLYTLMLDRASVSCENGYLEPDGSIRIYFTVEDVRQKLHKGKQRSVAVLRELEACGLIRRRKRGQGRPAVITLNYPDDVRFVERKGEAHDL